MSAKALDQRGQDVKALAVKLSDAADGAPHTLLLEALINLFLSVALKHDCCAAPAARVCLQAAEKLQSRAAHRPDGAPIH